MTDTLQVSADGKTYEGTNDDQPDKRPKLTGVYVAPANQPNVAKSNPGGSTQSEKRQNRWSIAFPVKNGPEYVAQLRGLGAILAIPVREGANGPEYRIIRDLSARPARLLNEDIEAIRKDHAVNWVDRNNESVRSVLLALGLQLPNVPSHFMAFLSKEAEEKLTRLELDYLKEQHPGRTEDDIALTQFRFKTGNGKYVLEVVELKLK